HASFSYVFRLTQRHRQLSSAPSSAAINWRSASPMARPARRCSASAAAAPPAPNRCWRGAWPTPGGRDIFSLPLRHAGTGLCDLRLRGDDSLAPMPVRALVVAEREPVAVDRDEVLLIEDVRLDGDGRALAPGRDARRRDLAAAAGTASPAPNCRYRSGQRLRLRFVNRPLPSLCGQRSEIADHDLRVMAVDGQPAEPFVARAGRVVLAPGSRVDAVLHALRLPGSEAVILLHDGSSALGRSAGWSMAPNRRCARPPPPRSDRCHPMAYLSVLI
ncbi:MAG: hypothetical protein MZV49_27430, partial [Rhodopseudomonas palustris]|nr:hypothetical protein [Rhodopseudomonas palustris]